MKIRLILTGIILLGFALSSSSCGLGKKNNSIQVITRTPLYIFSIQSVSSSTAGNTFSLSMTAHDGSDKLKFDYTGTIHFSSTDMQAVLPPDYQFTSKDLGTHSFSNIVLKTAGNQTITIQDNAANTTAQVQINVSPAASSHLSIDMIANSTASAGTPFTVQPIVQVTDLYGNVTPSATGTVTLMAYTDSMCTNPGTGTLGVSQNPMPISSGQASFSGVNYTLAGGVYIGASGAGVTPVCSPLVQIVPGAPSKLVYTTQPSASGVAGIALTAQPQVGITDAYGNFVTNATNSVSLTADTDNTCSTAGTGLLGATAPVTPVSGVASFAGVSYTKAGTVFLKATSSGLSQACSNAIAIVAGSPSVLGFSVSPPSSATAGVVFSQQPQVTVTDSFGNLATTPNVAVTLAPYTDTTCKTIATGTLSASMNPVNSSSAVAAFSNMSYTAAGTFYIGASASGLTSICSNAINVSAGAPSILAFSMQPSPTGIAGVMLAQQPQVRITDGFGNLAGSPSASVKLTPYTDSACKNMAPGTFTVNTNPLSTSSGVANFSGISYTIAGNLFIGASATGLSSACSNGVSIAPAAASKLAFLVQPPSTAVAGTPFITQPTVEALDAYGNLATTSSVPVMLTAYTDAACSVPATGTLTANANPVTTASGNSAFSGVQYSIADSIYLGANSTGLMGACSSLVNVSSSTTTGTAILTWNANTDSITTGYKVYYGTASGVYTTPIDVGTNITYTFPSLPGGNTYYFSVTAYNSSGIESLHSNEVSKAIP